VRLRTVTDADAERAAEIVIAVDIAEMGAPDYSLADLQDEWNEPGFDRDKDAIAVEDDQHTMIGYAHFRGGDVLAVVDPQREGEGAGTALLGWAEQRARERGDTRIRQAVGDQAVRSRALLEAHGYEVARSYYRLERDVDPSDTEPPGLRVMTLADAPAAYALHEAAFSSRPDYTHRSEEVWTQREFGAHSVALDLSRIAEHGFALTRRWEDNTAYVPLIAVHPEHQGQGLGGRLLQAVFAAAAQDGIARVFLSVASDNPNALHVYERVGMTQRWRIDDYQKALPD
jgi:ribosomal protein S18 acetylase RimI-like enzyme